MTSRLVMPAVLSTAELLFFSSVCLVATLTYMLQKCCLYLCYGSGLRSCSFAVRHIEKKNASLKQHRFSERPKPPRNRVYIVFHMYKVLYTYIRVYIYIYIHTCIYIFLFFYLYIYFLFIYIYIYIHTLIFTFLFIYIYIYIRMHISIYRYQHK